MGKVLLSIWRFIVETFIKKNGAEDKFFLWQSIRSLG